MSCWFKCFWMVPGLIVFTQQLESIHGYWSHELILVEILIKWLENFTGRLFEPRLVYVWGCSQITLLVHVVRKWLVSWYTVRVPNTISHAADPCASLECPQVDLSWTGVFPCELGWRGSALAVAILSVVFLVCYSLITACLLQWNTRKKLKQIIIQNPSGRCALFLSSISFRSNAIPYSKYVKNYIVRDTFKGTMGLVFYWEWQSVSMYSAI